MVTILNSIKYAFLKVVFCLNTYHFSDMAFLPNIKLGISIKDDCNSELVALYQTIKMIEEPKLLKNKFFCGRNDSPLIGMIGSASSDGEFQAENLLKFFKIPQIGYTTSSTELKWPYFYLSVAPSEYHQALLIIKILKKYDWRYISVAYSESEYYSMAIPGLIIRRNFETIINLLIHRKLRFEWKILLGAVGFLL